MSQRQLRIVPSPEPEQDMTSGDFERFNGRLLPQWMLLKRPDLARRMSREERLEILTQVERRTREELRQQNATHRVDCAYTWLGKASEEGLEQKSFDNFSESFQQKAYDAARVYATHLIEAQKYGERFSENFLLIGGVGLGKTHLTVAVLNMLREAGIPCLFATAQRFFDALYAADFERKDELIEYASATPLFALDDLSNLYIKLETDDTYQKKALLRIMDSRYTRRLPTIITTNEQKSLDHWLSVPALDRIFERYVLVQMQGKSYRRMLAERNGR